MAHHAGAVTPPESVELTCRGQAALDELATVLTARCSHNPEGIVKILDHVMHTDLDDLTEAFSAIGAALDEQRATTQDRRHPADRRASRSPGSGPSDTARNPDKPQKPYRNAKSVIDQGSTATTTVPTVGKNGNY